MSLQDNFDNILTIKNKKRKSDTFDKQLQIYKPKDSTPEENAILCAVFNGKNWVIYVGAFEPNSIPLIVDDGHFSFGLRMHNFNEEEALFFFENNCDDLDTAIEQLQNTELEDETKVQLASDLADLRFYPNHTKIDPRMLLKPRSPSDQSDDVWATSNCILKNLASGGIPTNRGRTRPCLESYNVTTHLSIHAWRHMIQLVE